MNAKEMAAEAVTAVKELIAKRTAELEAQLAVLEERVATLEADASAKAAPPARKPHIRLHATGGG